MRRSTLASHRLLGLILLGTLTLRWPAIGQAGESGAAPDPQLGDELQLIKEEESVSVALRYEQPISQSPSNVYVITDEDIRQSGATDIPTVLRRVPGIEVMQATGADFNVSVRGDNQLNANKLLVLIDGRSVYIDLQGSVMWKMLPVTLPEIKRIEVLKGPAAAVYGFNAFDGIINIITKSPDEMKGTTLQFGGGELGTITSAAIQAGRVGSLGYRLSVGRDQSQEWRNRDALAFRAHKVNLATEYALPADAKLSIAGGIVDANRFDGQLVETVLPANRITQSYASAAYERPNFFIRGWWNGFATTSMINVNPLLANLQTVTNVDGSVPTGFFGDTLNLETQHSLDMNDSYRLTYGVNYRYNTFSGSGADSFSHENRLGVYLQNEWRPTRSLTAVVGARYDVDTFINPTVSPRVALLYKPAEDHTLRLAMSVGYRPPTLVETHETLLITTTLPVAPPPVPPLVQRQTLVGNTGLAPEQIISYEAGYQGWFLKHRLRLRADLFYNHLSDLIFPGRTSPTSPATFLGNGGQADIYGGEAGVEVLITGWLSGFANYSRQEIRQNFTGTAQRGAPRDKWNVGLRAESDVGVSGEAVLHHVGAAVYPVAATFSQLMPFGVPPIDTRVGSYNLLNLRTGYKFWKQKAAAGYMREAEVAFSAFNALNDKHKEHPLGDTIGSRVMGWLTVRF